MMSRKSGGNNLLNVNSLLVLGGYILDPILGRLLHKSLDTCYGST